MVQHADIDHTGLTGVGGGAGNVLVAARPGFVLATNLDGTAHSAPVASAAYMQPIVVAGPMLVRAFQAHMQAAASGTYQWGLFDFSASVAAATKLAGGSGAMNATGVQTIAATGAPVSIDAGTYLLIMHAPAANVGSIYRAAPVASVFAKSQTSYAWDDTPNVGTGWSNTSNIFQVWLTGDLNGSTQW